MSKRIDVKGLILLLAVSMLGIMVFSGQALGAEATIYYQQGFKTPYIHYCPDGGSWTEVPGEPMEDSQYEGYSVKTIDLGDASQAQVCFNNGSGDWDSNSGENYIFSSGISTFEDGTITSGAPEDNSGSNTATIYYQRGFETPYIHYCPEGGSWTEVPGEEMEDSQYEGYSVKTIDLGDASQAQVCFNNGSGDWDSNGGENYLFSSGTSTFEDGTITSGIPGEDDDEDTTPPEVTPSLEPKRYEDPQSVIFNVTDNQDDDPELYYTVDGSKPQEETSYLYSGEIIEINESMKINVLAVDEAGNTKEIQFRYYIGPGADRVDFREETIYFVITTRFFDGDSSNNVHCWADDQAGNPDSDPAWRGDFKGLAQKLDYIKALGFSAVWITPVVENMSGYDYHGYHAVDFKEVDPRYESENFNYQDLIDAVHARGMKIIQDVVLNHTSNFGEENLFPLFTKDPTNADTVDNLEMITDKLPDNYDDLTAGEKYSARINLMKTEEGDPDYLYHNEKDLGWEDYTVQTAQIAGDCVDLNTENPEVANYLVDAYTEYINMGVDAFRVDTVKHISRLTLNNYYLPELKNAGGDDFFMFGETCARWRGSVWNFNIPAISPPFYTWKESQDYPWGDAQTNLDSTYDHWQNNDEVNNEPTSNNAFLNGNQYHQPDWSQSSYLNQIDFPMHWSFNDAQEAFNIAVQGDKYYNDARFNVTYVDSHDYAPDGAPSDKRFSGSQSTWAENLSLMFTFRGIPTIYYGSEIEFMKGAPIDVGPNAPLSETGRAYFGNHLQGSVDVAGFGEYSNATGELATTLSHPLAQHIRRLNLIRREIPALQKGQYSTENIDGNLAFKRRYTDEEIDSFVLVTISEDATFNNIPNGTYVDAVTGSEQEVTANTLTANCSVKGNMRVYVLDMPNNPAPGKIGQEGKYLK